MTLTSGGDFQAFPCLSHWNYPSEALQGVAVLVVSPDQAEHRVISGLFAHTNWVLNHATSLKDAWLRLEQIASPVVLVSQAFPDEGNWSDLLGRIAETPDAPRVIVTTHRLTPELCEQALQQGAFEVLAWPLKAAQLYPAVSDAWRQWKCYTGHTMAASA
jgi:DNA-binding NtrC family response regulator